ncbi:MAG: hypothetical protein QOF61_71 [Acidobacteriota bacterium]|jgi:hypothetical protein|nr:hypothetical protein [Acidobacteriota bacterium]
MDELDEFDEELIDEEASAGDADDDGEPEDDDDDDDSAEFRAALLSKHEMIALISLRTAARGGRIVRVDPRQPLPAAKFYEDPAEALRWFRRSLATSRRNGWVVVYDGEPLFG